MPFIQLVLLLILPCQGVVYPPVDPPAPIIQAFGDHRGLDYGVILKPVRVTRSGEVIEMAQDSSIYGRYVLVKFCDGYAGLYAHLSETRVHLGQMVYAGEVIGISGGAVGADGSGDSSGYHLHFEVRPPGHVDTNDFNVSPVDYLQQVGQVGKRYELV